MDARGWYSVFVPPLGGGRDPHGQTSLHGAETLLPKILFSICYDGAEHPPQSYRRLRWAPAIGIPPGVHGLKICLVESIGESWEMPAPHVLCPAGFSHNFGVYLYQGGEEVKAKKRL